MSIEKNEENYNYKRLKEIKRQMRHHQLGKALTNFEQYKKDYPYDIKIEYYDDLFQKLIMKSNPNYSPELLIDAYKELESAYDKGQEMSQSIHKQQQGNIEEVIPHFSELLKTIPYDKIITIRNLAEEYKKTNNPELARNILLRANNYGYNEYVLLDLINLDLKLNHVKEAKYCIKKFPRPIKNKNIARTLNLLRGRMLQKEEKNEKALTILKSRLGEKKDEIYWHTQYEIAKTYIHLNKIEKALQVSVEIEKNNGIPHDKLLFLKANINKELGNKKESLICLGKILASETSSYKDQVIDQLDMKDYLTIAALANRSGQYDDCKKILSQIDDTLLDKTALNNLKEIRFYLEYKTAENPVANLNANSYFEKQLIDYNEELITKKVGKHLKVPGSVNVTKKITRIINNVKSEIKDQEPMIDGMVDKYIISQDHLEKANKLSKNENDLLEVTTLPNTDLVLSINIMNQEEKPKIIKKKRG